MKKYTKSQRYQDYIRKRARKSLQARLRFQRYRRAKNRAENGLSSETRKAVRRQRKFRSEGYHIIKAPNTLCFVRNAEEVSEFISTMRDYEESKMPVFVVLKDVEQIDYDGITVLLSAVVRFKARHILFNGDFPNDPGVRQTIMESGFFEYINKRFKNEDRYELKQKRIFTHAKKNVDSTLGEKIIESASMTVWGTPKRCPGVQRVLLELMQNTNNHASFGGIGEKHWWLSVKHVKEERKVIFSFVDYGVGVFKSLKRKRPENKFFGAMEQLYHSAFNPAHNDSGVLKLIFQGELHRTATGKTYRGKGLPGIYQAFEKKQISNLSMITNRVVFNSKEDEYSTLLRQFEGTFVSWELNANNSKID